MGLYSSGGGQQTSSTKVEYSPEEQAARNKIFAEADTTYGRAKERSMQVGYAGPRPVGPTNSTQNAWDRSWQAANTIDSAANRYDDQNMQTLMMGNAENNPYLQGSIRAAQRPLIEQFMNAGGPMSTIRNNSVANGTFGGSRQGIAEGLAMRGLQDKLGDISATMSNDNYKTAMMQRNDAVKNSQMLSTMRLLAPQLVASIGKDREGYIADQENFDANAREHERSGMWEPLNNLANVIYGGSNGTQTTSSSIPKQNNTGQVLGSLGSAALMAMMFS